MTPGEHRTVKGIARGIVQGVGFRWFVREQARERDLAGWVRNMPDGAVEFVASGAAASVNEFLDSARVGPKGARVQSVEVNDFVANDLERPFYIRR